MIVEIRRQAKVITVIDDVTLTVPAGGTQTVNSDDFDLKDWDRCFIMATLGTETNTATFDAKLQIKDSNGNYFDHPSGSLTQMTAAGSQSLAISVLHGATGRIQYVYGDAENDAFAHVTLEVVLRS